MRLNAAQFLKIKIAVYSRTFQNRTSGMAFARMLNAPLDEILRSGQFSKARSLRLERDIDQFAQNLLGDDGVRRARDELLEWVGFDQLGSVVRPRGVVDSVLKRGRLQSDREARIVRDFLSNSDSQGVLSKSALQRLGEILDSAGC